MNATIHGAWIPAIPAGMTGEQLPMFNLKTQLVMANGTLL
jgi:hypothetical protein